MAHRIIDLPNSIHTIPVGCVWCWHPHEPHHIKVGLHQFNLSVFFCAFVYSYSYKRSLCLLFVWLASQVFFWAASKVAQFVALSLNDLLCVNKLLLKLLRLHVLCCIILFISHLIWLKWSRRFWIQISQTQSAAYRFHSVGCIIMKSINNYTLLTPNFS